MLRRWCVRVVRRVTIGLGWGASQKLRRRRLAAACKPEAILPQAT